MWLIKDLGWDQQVPGALQLKWNEYRESLRILNQLSVSRRISIRNSDQAFEIHGFSDASEKAYEVCLYMRTVAENGEVNVMLICSKARVAPLKLTLLPRLELCGALLLAQLLQKTLKALDLFNINNITLWTDSTIVLHWLNSPPKTWQTYVDISV
ncbi:uncharacterized protein LOC142325766 [Lycorma delicatula]|uniref:uncharacterized protein LOC142325766 n=1 Tax=Lycorma delicatula TaxID=130591 RepID=UPI003F5186F8